MGQAGIPIVKTAREGQEINREESFPDTMKTTEMGLNKDDLTRDLIATSLRQPIKIDRTANRRTLQQNHHNKPRPMPAGSLNQKQTHLG